MRQSYGRLQIPFDHHASSLVKSFLYKWLEILTLDAKGNDIQQFSFRFDRPWPGGVRILSRVSVLCSECNLFPNPSNPPPPP